MELNKERLKQQMAGSKAIDDAAAKEKSAPAPSQSSAGAASNHENSGPADDADDCC